MATTIRGRLVGAWVADGGLLICFMPGTDFGVSQSYRGWLLHDSGDPVAGSEFRVIRADARSAFAKVKIGLDQLTGREVEIALEEG